MGSRLTAIALGYAAGTIACSLTQAQLAQGCLPLSPPKKSDALFWTSFLVELKAAKTHTVLYQINKTEFYCQVDLPLSDYPLYGKQLVASRG